MPRIEIKNVTKIIKKNMVLKNIDLTLNGGKVYGLIGKNGSGKTMLLRVIGGLVKPTEGQIKFEGNRIGITIENAMFYPSFTGFENLKFLAGVNKSIQLSDIKDAMTEVGLNSGDKRKVGKYSLGMKQRLAIAQAVMEKPDFLLLDEPTNALDEDGIEKIRNLIRSEAERGAVVLLASHNHDDIEQLCDHIYIMSDGEINE